MPSDKELRPTVIGPAGAFLGKPSERSRQLVSPPGSAPSPAAPVVREPTAIPGAQSKRIEVPPGELERLSPGAPAGVYAQARTLIAGFVPEKATERRAILWRQDLQQGYSELVSEAVTLSRSPLLRKIEGYLTRTMDILASIDLLAATGHRETGVIERLFQRVTARVDTPEKLAGAEAELERLVALMAAALPELLDLKERLIGVSERTDAARAQLQAAAIAALFLSQRLRDRKDAVAQRFAERAMSLTQTLALIQEGTATRELQLDHPARLVRTIQEVALVMLPGFIGSLASAALMPAGQARLSRTEAGELGYRLADIVEKLKSS